MRRLLSDGASAPRAWAYPYSIRGVGTGHSSAAAAPGDFREREAVPIVSPPLVVR